MPRPSRRCTGWKRAKGPDKERGKPLRPAELAQLGTPIAVNGYRDQARREDRRAMPEAVRASAGINLRGSRRYAASAVWVTVRLAPAGSAHDQYALVVVDGGARGLQGGLAGTVVVTAQQQVDRSGRQAVAGIITLTTGLAGQQQARSVMPSAMPSSVSSSASLARSARVTVLRCMNPFMPQPSPRGEQVVRERSPASTRPEDPVLPQWRRPHATRSRSATTILLSPYRSEAFLGRCQRIAA